MSNFVKAYSNNFCNNASCGTCSSSHAVNNTADFGFATFSDTVFAVSVLLCSLIAIISLALLGLIDIIIPVAIIIIICIGAVKSEKRNMTLQG